MGALLIGDITNTAISFGPLCTYQSSSSDANSIIAMSPTIVIVAFVASGGRGYVTVGSVSDNTAMVCPSVHLHLCSCCTSSMKYSTSHQPQPLQPNTSTYVIYAAKQALC